MLGFADFWVAAAYWLCIASTVLCVIYGAMKWNETEDDIVEPVHPADENLDFEETV